MLKYIVDDTVFIFNLFKPLVAEFKVHGVMRTEEGIYYSCDGKNWVREDYLHETEMQAYFALISQAENEMGDELYEDYTLPTNRADIEKGQDKINE